MLVIIAVLLSLVIALATAFVFYATKESFLGPVSRISGRGLGVGSRVAVWAVEI
ncbi:hypothetical protein [Streptomyces brevispora]|uniref:hypothetical protein n=1 Tax=Streptomyces brevispora TaxID=887462 RepID=UPI0038031BED